MQEIIRNLAVKHELTPAEVVAVVERVFSDMLARFYGHVVVASLDATDATGMGLAAMAYPKGGDGMPRQMPVEPAILKRFRQGRIPSRLEKSLLRLKLAKEVARYKRHEHELRWGEIIGCDHATGELRVEVEIEDGIPIIAKCPLDKLGKHERHLLAAGERRAFHLRTVEPLLLNGTPRLQVVLDRVSRHLPSRLLVHYAGVSGIRCLKRYVGEKSYIVSPKRLPKAAILAVKKELGEHIQVNVSNRT